MYCNEWGQEKLELVNVSMVSIKKKIMLNIAMQWFQITWNGMLNFKQKNVCKRMFVKECL